MTPPISAVLITLNAESHLERVLAALAGCAEIVVLDSGSTDGTQAICARFGVRFHTHPFDGFGPQKRRAVDLATHDWVLSVDADEVLAADLSGLDLSDPARCFRIRRRNHIGDQEVRHGHWNPDWCLRLFNRRVHTFSADAVHESVRPTGPVATIPGALLHYGYADLGEIIRMKYHRMKAARYRAEGRRAGGLYLAVRAAAAFLRSYVLKSGWRDGPIGVCVALSAAVNACFGLAMASARPESCETGAD
jgi:glycosyltransferase involved in cell wall biosynthesis